MGVIVVIIVGIFCRPDPSGGGYWTTLLYFNFLINRFGVNNRQGVMELCRYDRRLFRAFNKRLNCKASYVGLIG
jgi:hypothetical protein